MSMVLVPKLVGAGAHRLLWGDAVQGRQRGWESPRPPSILLDYPMVRVPRVGEATVRAMSALRVVRRAGAAPELVHGHFLHEVGVAAEQLARMLGVPSVITIHGTDARWVLEGGVQERHRRRMLEAARRADRVLVVNRAMYDAFAAQGIERIDVLPMGVDERIFQPRPRKDARQELGLSDDVPIVLFVGRPTEEKGFGVLERALTRLDGVFAFAAGPEPPPGSQVTALGVLSPSQLSLWLNAADVMCLPSFAEGMPVAVAEALATGTPVVATRVGGIPEQVGEVSGVVVEPGDDRALADALGVALGRTWDRQAIRESSRGLWWSVLGPRLVSVYRELAP
jgi:glycosyltransferase involved in cell wall biosynthesis